MTTAGAKALDHRMDAREFFERRGEFEYCELLSGQVRRIGPARRKHGKVEAGLTHFLYEYLEERGVGEVVCGEVGYQLSQEALRGADIAVHLDPPPEEDGWETVMPDVIVEVVSPSDSWVEVEQKIADYLDAGVGEVWIANPRNRTLMLRSADGLSKIARPGEVFESRALEGFRIKVDKIFP